MRAVQIRELIGPDGLTLVEVPEPEAGEGVLIDIEAAGVSFADLLMSQGRYQMREEPPFIPGMEAAGTVRSAPEGCGLEPGDRVCGSVSGAFAEVGVGRPRNLFRLPESLSWAEGAALTVNYQTALFSLVDRARFQAGESLLVLGAAGGTGTSAIQVARGLGASKIVGLVSTEEKARIAREAGADDVVLISDKWKDEARAASGGSGFDLVYDPVGDELFLDGLRTLAPYGRLLVIGFAGGSIPQLKVNRLLLNNIAVVGAAWGEAMRREPEMPGRVHERLLPLIDKGFIRPPIGASFPLEQAADAYRRFAERTAVGKIILAVR
ncbi:MAG: NADPH:quinone oxidoreductase family protein [Deltaproteobacteria bacterium]|nr:NADPH:quinone oxidoreductase family protein [Deltaproteobacteria bacterium]